MDHEQQLRNLRDFLLVYNRMTEICFQRCTSNLNYRNLTMDEERCVDNCAGKLIRSNHRLMGTYVQLMPRIVQKRLSEMESKAAEASAAGADVEGRGAEPVAGSALLLTGPGAMAAGVAAAGGGPSELTVPEVAPRSDRTTDPSSSLLPAENLSLQPQPARGGPSNSSSLSSVHHGQQPAAPS